MADTKRYIPLRGNLSPEAHEGWQWFATKYRVTLAGFLEALGLELCEVMDDPKYKPSPLVARALDRAAAIDVERRSRKRKE